MEGKRRQPQGFKTVQVLSAALGPRTKMLYGFNDAERDAVWELVVTEAPTKANGRLTGATRIPDPRAIGIPHLRNVLNRSTRSLVPITLAA